MGMFFLFLCVTSIYFWVQKKTSFVFYTLFLSCLLPGFSLEFPALSMKKSMAFIQICANRIQYKFFIHLFGRPVVESSEMVVFLKALKGCLMLFQDRKQGIVIGAVITDITVNDEIILQFFAELPVLRFSLPFPLTNPMFSPERWLSLAIFFFFENI